MPENESEMKAQRRKKLRELQAMGLDPYQKYVYVRTHDSKKLKKDFEKIGPERS